MKKIAVTCAQVLLFIVLARFSDWLVSACRLPIPGSLAGIAIVFGLLKTGVLKTNWVELGSGWLLGQMLLFFVPATVRIVEYRSLIVSSGIQIVVTIAISTFAVMACAGLVAQRLGSRRAKGAE